MAHVRVQRAQVRRQVEAIRTAADGLVNVAGDVRGRAAPAGAAGFTGRPSSEAALTRFLDGLCRGLEQVRTDLVAGGQRAEECMTRFATTDRRRADAYTQCVQGPQ